MAHTCRGTINLATAHIDTEDACNIVLSSGGRTYHLKASTEVERQRWVTALELAKAKAIRMMNDQSGKSVTPIRHKLSPDEHMLGWAYANIDEWLHPWFLKGVSSTVYLPSFNWRSLEWASRGQHSLLILATKQAGVFMLLNLQKPVSSRQEIMFVSKGTLSWGCGKCCWHLHSFPISSWHHPRASHPKCLFRQAASACI